MGGENLDAIFEPIAEILILLLVLIAVAAVSIFLINKIAGRRRDMAHRKVSNSKRTKHTQVDLLGGSASSRGKAESREAGRRTIETGGRIDILAPKNSPDQPDLDEQIRR